VPEPKGLVMFKKLVVANRGEIAIRIIRACKELSTVTVCVYSEADRLAPFARYADEAYCIGPAPARSSYLCPERVIDVAKRTGAEAVHPGYGFLAENRDFARVCEASGIRFVGPRSDSITAMGDKLNARRLMEAAKVPVVPGSRAITDIGQAHEEARRLKFPVLIKPSSGGGGIGMRVIEDEAGLEAGLRISQSTARAAFGEPTVYLEKYLPHPRHIEFQIIAARLAQAVASLPTVAWDGRGGTPYAAAVRAVLEQSGDRV